MEPNPRSATSKRVPSHKSCSIHRRSRPPGFLYAICFASLLPVGCGAAGAQSTGSPNFQSLVGVFSYSSTRPLDVREVGVEKSVGLTVHDISYASPVRGRVTTYLVIPGGPGPFPAVLWQPGVNGGRSDQLDEARALARKGAASLLVDPPHVRPGGPTLISCRRRDRTPFIQYVVELRRGIDLLASRPEIDSSRLGDVGFSYGSSIAGVLAGVEHRLKAVVIESGRAYNTGFLRDSCKSELSKKKLAAYVRNMSFSDPVRYVGHAAPSSLLIQNGGSDPFTPRKEATKLQRAASLPKTIRWYRGSHELTPQAYSDRDRFLETQLAFG